MDHSEVRELLEDAAIEPGGLERLMAGDTPTASIVAGHLAGCPDCAEELERLRRSVSLIGPTVRAVPPPELRERTLAFVAAVGRPRGSDAPSAIAADPSATRPAAMPHVPEADIATDPTASGSADADGLVPFPTRRRSGAGRLGWLAGLAAALVVAIGGTSLVLNAGHTATTRLLSAEVDALGDVARWTLRVDAAPDVHRVALASTTGSAAGTLVFSPGSKELVVVAEGLVPPPADREYRCWIEVDGQRAPIGKMFFGGSLAYWVGEVPEVDRAEAGARFGVTLVDLSGADRPSEDVLVSAG